MNNIWIVLDVSGLAYRAFYSMRGLTFEGIPTAVTYGVLRDIIFLRDRFQSDKFVFCFDRGKSKRCEIYPQYKYKRRQESEEQSQCRKAVRHQIKILREEVLPDLGYRNLLSQPGYEADDLMGTLAQDCHGQRRMVFVSSDHDLFQLLSDTVAQWLPQKKQLINGPEFERVWGIRPSFWAEVLAIVGCSTDNVVGIKGVGIQTAVRYLRGEMLPARMLSRISDGREIIERNLELVRLPYPGTTRFGLVDDRTDSRCWSRVLKQWGIQTLRY